MKVTPVAELPGCVVFEPKVFSDDRGFFLETYNAARFAEQGVNATFMQDNWSRSIKGTLRGLHFQNPRAQGKLVQVMRGRVWDVAVDIRKGSPGFGKWFGVELSEENKKQLWIPPGFAHGFYVLSEIADFVYKCTDVYVPEADGAVRWNDPAIAIAWPLDGTPLLSAKDAKAPLLSEAKNLPSF
jgi:dTDP-4-dehydrorhamnose 3,5-epimerase